MWTDRMCLIVELSLLWVFCGFMATEGITIDPQRRFTTLQGTPNVQMTCPVQRYAVRPVTFQWFYLPTNAERATPINAGNVHFAASSVGVLTIDQVIRTDSGVFTSIATDSTGGSGNCTFYLEVAYPPVFDGQPVTTEVQANLSQEVILTCPYDSIPLSTVTWLKDSVILGYSRRFIIDGRNLTISDVQALDQGSYQCRASNAYGATVSSPITVSVEVPFEFLVTPDSVSIFIAGENATLTCSVRGSPRPTVEWKKESVTMTNSQLLTISETFADEVVKSTLEYKSIALNDRGTYTCSARNVNQAVNHLFEVVIYVPPVITSVFASIMRVMIGEPMTLLCQATGLPKASFTWYKDDRPISRVAETHFQEGWDGYLRVSEVIGSDAGLYQCRAVNEVGEAFSKSFTVVVTGLHFLVKPRPNMYIFTNKSAQMDCAVAGSQNNIDIEWRKNGQRVSVLCTEAEFNNSMCSGTFRMGNSLHVLQMAVEDEGLYSCIATERGTRNPETIRADTMLNVLIPVKIEPALPATMKGDFHRGLTVRCQATGTPTPKVEWLRHGIHVINNTYRSVIGGVIKFRALHVADAGRYTCIASNKAGEVAQNMQIIVNTILTTPAALNITAVPYNSFAQIKWSIIANGGYRVNSFNVEYRQIKPAVSVWTVYENVPANQRSIGIKELDAEAWYEVKVWANNQLGKGEVSTIEFQTKPNENGGILELSMSQLIIIVVIILAAIGMLLAIICVIVARRRNSNPAMIRGRREGEDNQALVHNQQDPSSHVNPAYMQGGATDTPQKDMELKEVKQNKSSGGGDAAAESTGGANKDADTKAESDTPAAATEQNGKAKKETTTT